MSTVLAYVAYGLWVGMVLTAGRGKTRSESCRVTS